MTRWISCAAILALSAGTAWAFGPQTSYPVHLHYDVVMDDAGRPLGLRINTCDAANLLLGDLKRLKLSDQGLNAHASLLHSAACALPKPQ